MFAQTDVSGDVSGTWTLENSPYNVIGDIQVQPYDSLTIDAGVTIEFEGNYQLIVNGVLNVNGNETDLVDFHSIGNWSGIDFEYSTGESNISHTSITGTDGTAISSYYSQAINISDVNIDGFNGRAISIDDTFSDVTISNTTIQNGSGDYYIYAEDTFLHLDNITMDSNNNASTGIHYSGTGSFSISNSSISTFNSECIELSGNNMDYTIENTNLDNCYYGLKIYNSTVMIDNSNFINNQYGIEAEWEYNISINSSYFQNNNEYGIRFGSDGSYLVNNCTFLDNSYGIDNNSCSSEDQKEIHNSVFMNQSEYAIQSGCWYEDAYDVYNCRISNNQYGISNARKVFNSIINNNQYGYGISNSGEVENCTVVSNDYGIQGVNSVRNSIVFFNSNSQIESSSVEYSVVQGGYEGTGNLDSNPAFLDFYDFHLHESSPAIDTGNPSSTYYDVCYPPSQGTYLNDIGAYGGPGACGWNDEDEIIDQPTIDVDISSATASPGDTVSISIQVGIPDTVSIFSISLSLNCLNYPLTMNNLEFLFYNFPDGWIGEVGNECPIIIWMAGSQSISGYSTPILTFDVEISNEATDQEIPITIDSVSFDEIDYNININEGSITIVTIPPIIPNYGDVSLNGSISPLDASMVLQYTVDLINLNEQQMLNADVTGDSSVSAMDASLILQYGVGLIEEFPVESGSTIFSANGYYFMDYYSYNDDTQFDIPIYLENGNDIYAFEHHFTYDSEMISIEEITKGDNIDNFLIQFNSVNNELIISGASSNPDGLSGVFFTINGSLNDANIVGQSTNLNLDQVRLNENEPDLYETNFTTLILNGTLGDLNSDTSLNILDLVITANLILGFFDPTEYQLWAADSNGDGEINILDLVVLVNIILGDSLSRGEPISKATIEYGNKNLVLSSDGAVSGIQLEISGDFIITGHNLPEGWQFFQSKKTILAFNMGGENISAGSLFNYEGDLSIESTIIADSYGNGVMATLQIIPDTYALLNSYPNPFNPVTSVHFTLPVESEVSLEVYNLQGRMVEALTSGNMQPGYHSVIWNADSYSSGVYFVKMIAGEYINTQKLMLIK